MPLNYVPPSTRRLASLPVWLLDKDLKEKAAPATPRKSVLRSLMFWKRKRDLG